MLMHTNVKTAVHKPTGDVTEAMSTVFYGLTLCIEMKGLAFVDMLKTFLICVP